MASFGHHKGMALEGQNSGDRMRGKAKSAMAMSSRWRGEGFIPWLRCTQCLHSPGCESTLADQCDHAGMLVQALDLLHKPCGPLI